MNKFLKVCLSLIVMSIITTITVTILNFLNVEQTDYLLYLLWINAIVVFYAVLPSKVQIE